MAWQLESMSRCLSGNEGLTLNVDGECLSITNEDGQDACMVVSGNDALSRILGE